MKNLQEIKNTYAIEQGYEDWTGLRDENANYGYDMEMHMDEICIRAQKLALEKAAKNVDSDYTFAYSSERNRYDEVISSITNPENLIR